MAITRFTRQAFLDLLWTKPLRLLAPEIGVSDAKLKKAAKRAGLPTPPLGHWVKLSAGKKAAVKPVLPPRGFGVPDEIEFGFEEWSYPPLKRSPAPRPPAPPAFNESMESVRERAVRAIGKVVVPRDLKLPHRVVRRLLADDAARAEKAKASPILAPLYPLRYVTPADHRKLSLLSALALGLTKAEVKLDVWRAEHATVHVRARHGFPVSVRGKTERGRKPSDAGGLSIVAGATPNGGGGVIAHWDDDQNHRLEAIVTEIVVEIVVLAEKWYRQGRLNHHKWLTERWAAEVEEARKAKEEAERHERERMAKLERNGVDRLLHDADGLHQADAIRAYVAEAGQRSAGDVNVEAFDRWRRWALEQADRIDRWRAVLS